MSKKGVVTMKFDNEEMNLLSQAVELLYNRTIGEMMFKTEDDLRELLNKINKNNEIMRDLAKRICIYNGGRGTEKQIDRYIKMFDGSLEMMQQHAKGRINL
jgi:hypothetical protein